MSDVVIESRSPGSKRVRSPPPVQQDESQEESEEQGRDEGSPEPKRVKAEPQEEVKLMSNLERDLRSLFGRERGYRLNPEDVNLSHLSIRLSRVTEKKMAEYRAKAGRALKNMKDRYVNLNSLFSPFPADEEILSKFIPNLAEKCTEPYRVILLSPPCKMKWVHLTGLGSFDKTKYAPEKEQDAQHEFSLTVGAYNEELVDDHGFDPSAHSWMRGIRRMWKHISTEIARNSEIAPELHKLCDKDMEEKQPEAGQDYESAYTANYLGKYVKCKNMDLEQKFGTKMFRYPTEVEREVFLKGEGYKAPSSRMQQIWDEAGNKDKVVYNDMPVVRPKTKEEIKKAWESDKNPFVHVPFEEREAIKDGSIGACLYEVSITENHQGKSYFKTKPLLLIWIRDLAKQTTAKKLTEPFFFSDMKVSEEFAETVVGKTEQEEGEPQE